MEDRQGEAVVLKKEDQLVKDLVCGMVKPKSEMKTKTVYKGKTYYFCLDQDRQMFEKNPEHWIPSREDPGK